MFDPLQSALKVSSSGLEAQSKRLRVVSENLANAQSTGRIPGADPYARKTISFESEVDEAMGLSTVRVAGIERDRTPFRVEQKAIRFLPGASRLKDAVCSTASTRSSAPSSTGAPHSADTVVRRLERVTHGTLEPGDKVWLTPSVHIGNPSTALGLDHADVDIPGELGALPAWFVPGARDTWVITVHGLGTTREHPMNVMEFLHRHRFPVLDLAYRGDLGAPRSPDGLGHLGETEWRDLDAAIRYAVRYGAEQVVLHGWSTGATMALRAAAHSALRDRISGLVLDSPVLDWETTLRALAAARRTPGALLPLAVRAAQGRTGLHGDRAPRRRRPRTRCTSRP